MNNNNRMATKNSINGNKIYIFWLNENNSNNNNNEKKRTHNIWFIVFIFLIGTSMKCCPM